MNVNFLRPIKDLVKIGIFAIVFGFLYHAYSFCFAEPYTITETSPNTYEVDLQKEITDDNQSYHRLYDFLLACSEEDTVIFKIHGYGGSVLSATTIINGLKLTKAHTIAQVDSTSYSAHAYITCAVKEVHLDPYSYLMFHSVQSSKAPSKELQEASVGRLLTECKDKGYVSQTEIDRMLADNTVEVYYYNGKVVNKDTSVIPFTIYK